MVGRPMNLTSSGVPGIELIFEPAEFSASFLFYQGHVNSCAFRKRFKIRRSLFQHHQPR